MSWDMESVYDNESACERAGTLGGESCESERHQQVMGALNAIYDELETLNAQFREAFPPKAEAEVEIPNEDETAAKIGSPVMAGRIRQALREAHAEGYEAVEAEQLESMVNPSNTEVFWVTLETMLKAGSIGSNNTGDTEPTLVAYFLNEEPPKVPIDEVILQELRSVRDAGKTPITQGALHRRILDVVPSVLHFTGALWRMSREGKVVWHSPSLYEQSSYSLPKAE